MEARSIILLLMLIVAIVAAVYSPPKSVQVKALLPLLGGEGSPLDPGVWGRTLLVKTLMDMGFRVETSLRSLTPKPGEEYVLMLLGPTACNSTLIPDWVREAIEEGARVYVIIGVEWACRVINETLSAINAPPLLLGGYVNDTLALVTASGSIFIVYTAVEVSEQPGVHGVVFDAVTGSLFGVEGEGFTAIGDSHIFTNAMLSLYESRQRQLLALLLRNYRNATIVVPVEAYTPRGLPGLAVHLILHPATLTLLAYTLMSRIDAVASSLGAPPWLVEGLVASVALAAASLLASRRG